MNVLSTVVSLARSITRDDEDRVCEGLPVAFGVRAQIASIPYVSSSRSHLAPNFVSDLGLRRTDDPGQFLRGCLSQLDISTTDHATSWTPDRLTAAWNGNSISESAFAAHIDALISFAGMWDQAADLARQALDARRRPGCQQLLTYLGSALSADGDARAGELYVAASTAADSTPATHAMARIRYAAWQIKRVGDVAGGVETIDALEARLRDWVSGFEISAGDQDALMGVALNLKALAAVKAKDGALAKDLLGRALARLDTEGLVVVGEDERRRYFAQVNVNIAQLYCQAGAPERATKLTRRHLAWTRVNHPGSVSEALAVSGYVAYLCGTWLEAIDLMREAVSLIATEGSPVRLLMARKTLAVSLHKSGDVAAAQGVIESMSEDPLGLTLLERVS